MLTFVGSDGSKLISDGDEMTITFDGQEDEGLTLEDITSLEFDAAMFVRGLYFSGVYALDLYRIYTTDVIPAKMCIYYDIKETQTEYQQLYRAHWDLVGQLLDGAPINYKELVAIQKKMRSLSNKVQKQLSVCRKFVYSRVAPKIS